MIEAIVKRNTLLMVATLVVIVLGVLAVQRIPVQMIPDLDVRRISVVTRWPGATPQDVEKEILIEQEEYLRSIPNLSRLLSSATTGRAAIELEFPFQTDVTQALIDVNNALAQVPDYPEAVDEPRVTADSFSANSFMYYRIVPLPGNPLGIDMDMMQDFIDDNVRTRMERVPGVSQVQVNGGAERQVQILIDPAALAERRITPMEVRQQIRARNRDVSGGDVDVGKQRYLLRTIGRFDDLTDLENLIIARRGDAIVRLADVAEVRFDHFELRRLSFAEGQPALQISVNRVAGSNVIDIKRRLQPVIADINEDLLKPNGMRMGVTSDDVVYVENSVRNVWQNLALGTLFATLILFAFLRSRSATFVGVMGVPICSLAAFLGLMLFGRTINVISLAGVAFAIGMTLDNSIVVLEAIERERRKGLDPVQASVAGVRRVWSAVLASTLTTVLVFAPILFIKEEAGQLYSDVAVAVSASILMSWLVAVTVVPTAAARIRLADSAAGEDPRWMQRIVAAVNWLTASPRRRISYMALALSGTVLVLVYLTPPAEYLPEGEEPKLFAILNAPPGYSLSEMAQIAADINERLLPYVGDDPDRFAEGNAPVPALAYLNSGVSSSNVRLIVETRRPQDIDELQTVLTDLFRTYPGMRPFVTRGSIISSNDGGTRSVNIDVSGSELEAVYATAAKVYRRAAEVLERAQINSQPRSLTLNQPLIEVRPNWQRAAELGLDAQAFGFAVAAFSDGAYVDELVLGDDKVDIYLYGQTAGGQSLGRIPDLPMHARDGRIVPLSAVAEFVETTNTDAVRRVNGRRTVTLNVVAPRSVELEDAVQIVRQDIIGQLVSAGEIEPGINLDISGAADQLDATRRALLSNFAVALVLCYLLLVAIFNHWGYPLVIITVVPLGIAGGILGLLALNLLVRQPFDMISMLGFLILLGTVVNNPILIVDRTLSNLREGKLAPREAVAEALHARLRPIFMSMTTTVAGLAPLVFVPGAGTELYRGVGVIVLAGLLFAAFITVTLLPVLLTQLLERPDRAAVRSTTPSSVTGQ